MTATAPAGPTTPVSWQEEAHRVLKAAGIRQVAYVPDAGLTELIRRCEQDAELRTVSLTTEEEGVAMLAGAWLGGQRGILLMQSSGVGNCINMLALIQECRIPLLALVTMRGTYGEANPWQVPMGQTAGRALALAQVVVHEVARAEDAGPTLAAAARMAFESRRAVAALIDQRVVGSKPFAR